MSVLAGVRPKLSDDGGVFFLVDGSACKNPTPFHKSSRQVRQYHVISFSPLPTELSLTCLGDTCTLSLGYNGSVATTPVLRFSRVSKLSR